jgi:hypothetical protein
VSLFPALPHWLADALASISLAMAVMAAVLGIAFWRNK